MSTETKFMTMCLTRAQSITRGNFVAVGKFRWWDVSHYLPDRPVAKFTNWVETENSVIKRFRQKNANHQKFNHFVWTRTDHNSLKVPRVTFAYRITKINQNASWLDVAWSICSTEDLPNWTAKNGEKRAERRLSKDDGQFLRMKISNVASANMGDISNLLLGLFMFYAGLDYTAFAKTPIFTSWEAMNWAKRVVKTIITDEAVNGMARKVIV